MDFSNVNGDVVAIKLPNGTVKVVKNKNGSVGEIFESEDKFYSKYRVINESTGATNSCVVLNMING